MPTASLFVKMRTIPKWKKVQFGTALRPDRPPHQHRVVTRVAREPRPANAQVKGFLIGTVFAPSTTKYRIS